MYCGVRKRLIFPAILFLFISLSSEPIRAQELAVGTVKDGILLATGIGTALLSEFIVSGLEAPQDGGLDAGELNALDRLALFSYSERISRAGELVALVSLGLPAALLLGSGAGEFWPLAIVYLESFCYAFAAKNFLKYLVRRPRPYLYTQSCTSELESSPEAIASFPSGHTTLSFMSATFSTYLYCRQYHNAQAKILFAVLAYGLAGTTGFLRVLSGEHFLTDVLFGAALGTAVGFLIPRLHLNSGRRQDGASIVIAPNGLALRFSY